MRSRGTNSQNLIACHRHYSFRDSLHRRFSQLLLPSSLTYLPFPTHLRSPSIATTCRFVLPHRPARSPRSTRNVPRDSNEVPFTKKSRSYSGEGLCNLDFFEHGLCMCLFLQLTAELKSEHNGILKLHHVWDAKVRSLLQMIIRFVQGLEMRENPV